MADLPPMFTVRDGMIACGISDVLMFQGESQAQRIADGIFSDDFNSVIDINIKELPEDYKAYSSLTATQGKIMVNPGQRNKVKAWIQWCRDKIRMGGDPSTSAFNPADTMVLLNRMKTHELWVKNSPTMAGSTKPQQFTKEITWKDWEPTFLAFLGNVAGRNGVPLKYVVRPQVAPDPTFQPSFLDMYINMAPLNGEAYVLDNLRVLQFLNSFIVTNTEAENSVQALNTVTDGRQAYLTLKVFYEGQGIMAVDIERAEHTLIHLFYAGEKYPTMWWVKFELELKKAYAIIQRENGGIETAESAKIRHLQRSVKADFLQQAKTNINARLAEIPMTMTFATAMQIYRNTVQQTYPAGSNKAHGRRTVQEMRSSNGGRGHGRSGKGRGGRGRQKGKQRYHKDQENITLNDGRRIKYHPSFLFTRDELDNMTEEQFQRLKQQRAAYKAKTNGGRGRGRGDRSDQNHSISELTSTMNSFIQSMSRGNLPPVVTADDATQDSALTGPTRGGNNIIGGGNQQRERGGGRI